MGLQIAITHHIIRSAWYPVCAQARPAASKHHVDACRMFAGVLQSHAFVIHFQMGAGASVGTAPISRLHAVAIQRVSHMFGLAGERPTGAMPK